mmetsp:Transcript_45046/g.107023  ORF Transcript_45046/g.107023 Transcript_45046/m.107023 type:complete len:653 (+) Transcript_45046:68-2026(+)
MEGFTTDAGAASPPPAAAAPVSSAPPTTTTTISGWVLKRKPMSRWGCALGTHRRHFILDFRIRSLYYGHSEDGKVVCMPTPFSELLDVELIEDFAKSCCFARQRLQDQYGFRLRTKQEELELMCPSQEEAETWVRVLRHTIKSELTLRRKLQSSGGGDAKSPVPVANCRPATAAAPSPLVETEEVARGRDPQGRDLHKSSQQSPNADERQGQLLPGPPGPKEVTGTSPRRNLKMSSVEEVDVSSPEMATRPSNLKADMAVDITDSSSDEGAEVALLAKHAEEEQLGSEEGVDKPPEKTLEGFLPLEESDVVEPPACPSAAQGLSAAAAKYEVQDDAADAIQSAVSNSTALPPQADASKALLSAAAFDAVSISSDLNESKQEPDKQQRQQSEQQPDPEDPVLRQVEEEAKLSADAAVLLDGTASSGEASALPASSSEMDAQGCDDHQQESPDSPSVIAGRESATEPAPPAEQASYSAEPCQEEPQEDAHIAVLTVDVTADATRLHPSSAPTSAVSSAIALAADVESTQSTAVQEALADSPPKAHQPQQLSSPEVLEQSVSQIHSPVAGDSSPASSASSSSSGSSTSSGSSSPAKVCASDLAAAIAAAASPESDAPVNYKLPPEQAAARSDAADVPPVTFNPPSRLVPAPAESP